MHEVKSIGVLSLAKWQAVIPTIITAIFALPLLVLEAVVPGGGIGTYITIVFFTFVGGAISGAITALIYNALAAIIGGIELGLSESV